jgi:hypothetical protein
LLVFNIVVMTLFSLTAALSVLGLLVFAASVLLERRSSRSGCTGIAPQMGRATGS